MPIAASFILNLDKPKNMAEYRCVSKQLPIKVMSEGLVLSLSLGRNAIHVFN